MQRKTRIVYGLITALLLLTFLDSSAQYRTYHSPANFIAGDTVLCLADDVNVRAKCDVDAKIIATLPIAHPVVILRNDGGSYTLRGFDAPWYEVSFTSGTEEKTGFIWGGMLTASYDTIDASTQTLVLVGIYSLDKNIGYEGLADIQIRIAQGEVQVCKQTITGIGSHRTLNSVEITGGKKVRGVKNIIFVYFSDQFCGGAFGKQVFFWDGQNLKHVIKLKDGADAPYYYNEDLTFPGDEGGVDGIIIMKKEQGYYDTDEQKDVIESSETLRYKWNGENLIEQE